MNLLAKTLVSIALLGPAALVMWVAVLVTIRVWKGDVRTEWLSPANLLRRQVEEKTARFVREPDAVYQNDKIVGRVRGAKVDEAARRVTFEMILRAEDFDKRANFFFRRFRLQIVGDPVDVAVNITESGEPTGRTLENVTSVILGPA